VDWIGLAQDRNRWRALVNSILNLRVPWNAGKLLEWPNNWRPFELCSAPESLYCHNRVSLNYKTGAFIIVLPSSNYKASASAVNQPLSSYWCRSKHKLLLAHSSHLVADSMYYRHVTCRESAWRRNAGRFHALHCRRVRSQPHHLVTKRDVHAVSYSFMKDGRHVCLVWIHSIVTNNTLLCKLRFLLDQPQHYKYSVLHKKHGFNS
jgi:hypothetical protein